MDPITPIGLVCTVLVGGFTGWLAHTSLQSHHGLITLIILGSAGALLGNALFSIAYMPLNSILGCVIAGFAGATVLISITQLIATQSSNLDHPS